MVSDWEIQKLTALVGKRMKETKVGFPDAFATEFRTSALYDREMSGRFKAIISQKLNARKKAKRVEQMQLCAALSKRKQGELFDKSPLPQYPD